MKRWNIAFCFFAVVLFFIGNQAVGQALEGTLPPTYGSELIFSQIPEVFVARPEQSFVDAALARDSKNDMYVVSKLQDVDISTENAGSWEVLENGTSVWRCMVTGRGAKALSLHFDRFNLPAGSKLYVYDVDRRQLLGGYNEKDNTGDKGFAIGLVVGESVIIEYVAPSFLTPGAKKAILNEEVATPDLHIMQVSYFFRGVADLAHAKDIGDSESCEVNINCPEGDNWQVHKRSVVRIYVVEGNSGGWCSGTLINNRTSDGTPYILTANHCGPNATAANFNQWMFYFNLEYTTCQGTTQATSHTRTGCTKKAAGNMSGGSDFYLLQLNTAPDNAWNPIYAGWKRDNTAPSNGVGIHHPAGDVKKISAYATTSVGTYTGCANNAHWKVADWQQTQTNLGVTEGGSSGSALFDSQGYVVGTLTGGAATCAYPHNDYYGKLFYHWDQNGSNDNQRLKPWLDPENSGANTCPLYDPNNPNTPDPEDTTGTGGGGTITPDPDDPDTPDTPGTSGNCRLLHHPLQNLTIYRMQNDEYLAGSNSYGDIAKADYFTKDETVEYIPNIKMRIAAVSGNGNATFCIWADDNGRPGAVIASKTVPLSTIAARSYIENDPQMPTPYPSLKNTFLCKFDQSVPVDGNFFAGVILPRPGTGTLALVTNTNNTNNTAWEMKRDSTWVPYTDSSSWGVSLTHAFFPQLCDNPETSDIEDITLSDDQVIVYPNPTDGKISVRFANDNIRNAQVRLFDMAGKCLMASQSENGEEVSFHLDNLSSGLYLINIQSDNKTITKKISFIK